MGNVTSTLDIVLKDDVTRNAAQIEGALKRIGANVTQVTAATKALRDYAAAESLSANRSDWTKAQASGFRAMEGVIVSGTKQIMAAERALEEQRARATAERQRDLAADQRARARAFDQEQRLQHRAAEQREHAVSHHGIVNYALQSAAMAVSAHGMVHVGREAWEQGAELQRERIGLQNAGRTPEEIREIEHAARGVQASRPPDPDGPGPLRPPVPPRPARPRHRPDRPRELGGHRPGLRPVRLAIAPLRAGAAVLLSRSLFQAMAGATGYSAGDYLDHVVTADPASGAVLGIFWVNLSAGAKLALAPASGNISPAAPLPTGAATAPAQATVSAGLAPSTGSVIITPWNPRGGRPEGGHRLHGGRHRPPQAQRRVDPGGSGRSRPQPDR